MASQKMEMDYSLKGQEEFYAFMKEQRELIDGLDLSQFEKNRLHREIDNTLKRYNQNHVSHLNNQIVLAHLDDSWKKLEKGRNNLVLKLRETKTTRKVVEFCIAEIKKPGKDSPTLH